MLFEPATPHHKYGKNQTVFRKFYKDLSKNNRYLD